LVKFGQTVKVMRAEEPSNYIWENMQYTKLRRSRWFIYVMIGVAIALSIGYYIQFRITTTITQIDHYEKVDCKIFHNGFGNTVFESEDLKKVHLDHSAIVAALKE
tara:strand:- start:1828 stop:2142 length:315 start_codon:yes stop_codon:yes gene_type:complete